jgi:hypothetical protein
MILTPFLMDVAKVVQGIRPDWPLPSIHRALCSCGDRREAEIALAAVRVASDPDSKGPTRMTLIGPWWNPVDLTGTKPSTAETRMPPPFLHEQIRAVPPPSELLSETRARIRAARTQEATDA